MVIQAIETVYKGFRFRSRLEARWAVFMDALGIRWEYENEGFNLVQGKYLPDFWLPDAECFLEIKPNRELAAGELNRIMELATSKKVVVCSGQPWANEYTAKIYDLGTAALGQAPCDVIWGVCAYCHGPYLIPRNYDFSGWSVTSLGGRWSCPCFKQNTSVDQLSGERLTAAFGAARQARFEHGETPKLPTWRATESRRIYLAGKIGANDWRHDVVKDLRSVEEWSILINAIFGQHHYVGPYFISCDHGCYHGPNSHGLGVNDANHGPYCSGDVPKPHDNFEVVHRCVTAIYNADLFIAWIDSADCYGTVAEIGYAYARGTEIWIAGPERFTDLWFVYEMADRLCFGRPKAVQAIHHLLTTEEA